MSWRYSNLFKHIFINELNVINVISLEYLNILRQSYWLQQFSYWVLSDYFLNLHFSLSKLTRQIIFHYWSLFSLLSWCSYQINGSLSLRFRVFHITPCGYFCGHHHWRDAMLLEQCLLIFNYLRGVSSKWDIRLWLFPPWSCLWFLISIRFLKLHLLFEFLELFFHSPCLLFKDFSL